MNKQQLAQAERLERFARTVERAMVKLRLSRLECSWVLFGLLMRLSTELPLPDETDEDLNIHEDEVEEAPEAPIKGPQEPKHYPGGA